MPSLSLPAAAIRSESPRIKHGSCFSHRYAPGDRIPRRDQIKIFERVHEAVSAKKLELVGENRAVWLVGYRLDCTGTRKYRLAAVKFTNIECTAVQTSLCPSSPSSGTSQPQRKVEV